MLPLDKLGHAARAAITVARRRGRGAPGASREQADWPLRYRLLVEWLIASARGSFGTSGDRLARIRREMDLAGKLEIAGRRVHFVDIVAGGRPAIEVVPTTPGVAPRAVLYLHGGAYEVGSPRSHRVMMAGFAKASNARVVGLDYRLAPEHACPAAIDDAVAAWSWLLEQPGVDPATALIAGDSAGGGLTLTTTLALRDAGLPLPAGAVLVSPWTDLTHTAATRARPGLYDYLDGDEIRVSAKRYAGQLALTDPRVSPLFADSLLGLPPLLIFAGGAELLLEDSTRLADAATAAGVDVTLEIAPGEIHDYPMFRGFSPNAAPAFRAIRAFTERVAPV